MRDFNYFDPYIKVQSKPKSKYVLFIVLGALFLALIAYYQFYLIMQKNAIEDDIAEVDTFINSEVTIKKVGEITEKQNQEAALTMAYTDLTAVAIGIELTDNLDEMFVDEVNAQIPYGLFVSEFNATFESLSVKGYATEYDAIAQFAYNLRNSGSFQDVTIPSVTEDNGNYVYLINATLVQEGLNEN